ncbi:uncharacterized protein LOC130688203 [Daphnia carinata]|uniref:uncharacterized protein LOC130688203 n=1 Tax=Daphnia carinata TaxID=120202 RepID=UPI00257A02C2|nr:uncharacterized protein LOC130688203 [Daphnia carinata]
MEECACGGAMIVIQSASEEFLQCQVCGETREYTDSNTFDFDYIGSGDAGNSKFVHEDGEGAKTKGVKYNRAGISKGRQDGKTVIQTLCQNFNAGSLEKEILNVFRKLYAWRNLPAVAAAVFITVYRMRHPISIKQVLPVLDRPISLQCIGDALKKIEQYLKDKMPESVHTSTSASGEDLPSSGNDAGLDIVSRVRSVLPNLKVEDPFKPTEDITQRVYNTTAKIVRIFERRTKRSYDPRLMTIAAGYLAWQSCHYYDKDHNKDVPFTELREPTEARDYQKYLAQTHLTNIDVVVARSITRNVALISDELLQLFNHMTWIEKKNKRRKDIPKYLELILQFQGMTTDALNEEDEIQRLNEPIIVPIIPRELTAEEEAILDSAELSEKDLPDAEVAKYLRSDVELNPIDVHLSFSADLDLELAELEEKRQVKQLMKKAKSVL